MSYVVGFLLLFLIGIFVYTRIIYSKNSTIPHNLKKSIFSSLILILMISMLFNILVYTQNTSKARAVEKSHDRFMNTIKEDIDILRYHTEYIVDNWDILAEQARREKIDELNKLAYNTDFSGFMQIGQDFVGYKYGMQIYYSLWDYTGLNSSLIEVFHNTMEEEISKQELTFLLYDLNSILDVFHNIESQIEEEQINGEDKIKMWIKGLYEARQPLKNRGRSPLLRDWQLIGDHSI